MKGAGVSVKTDHELPTAFQVFLAAGHAQLYACALVGDTSFEQEQRHATVQYLQPVETKHGVRPLFGGHAFVGRCLPFHAVALREEDPKSQRLQFRGKLEIKVSLRLREQGPAR